ncbi:MAG TPA: pseudouridine synthase [Planctomycetota bacterium]|nr:pseudouridine synthase [Planctomycetota bacterium]
MTLERLHKVLASAGAGSRRECEQFIVAGRVTVDGEVVRELGSKVDPDVSEICLDFEVVKVPTRVYYMVNKPRGVISTTRDDMGRPGVVDLVPGTPRRVYPVGRLDADSVGLVLLTNDGELAQTLTHPSFEIRKTYEVRARGSVSDDTLEQLRKGVWLSDGRARVEGASIRSRRRTVTDLVISLHEGKNREIRRVMARVGHPVLELKRTSIGTLELGTLKEGRSRKLTAPEVQALKRLAGQAAERTKRGKSGTSRRPRRGHRGPPRRSRRG